ncbi:DUF2637 domain-containing protein [Streptomyces filamentosus]|uniref:DUF2637 domain-containing protein n=2 Tax=Streptomyces filamentosus TaxID=67294 RepID=A0ABY4UY82_STRFL|nr:MULTISPECIES: DUF2637 domain-containing protein [Streptomyces]EFE74993.1 mobile element transfer protein SpdA [Streptomyces filamentosus NRRL 15998]ESU47710.1 putative mobile element transfer protein [Streptomyces sp. HCCB10043]EWS92058.1 mobile element transfer protein SpdA [Streptomyces filamentosus NRRL 11379]MYR79081.1 DUF2637 domain-containing protein [Streptomyces sp. SID5466]USC49321.1 DUF2637 domain-containing protein [Streptomyces filamentosus]
MSRIRIDAVLIQAAIAGALSFAHLHDLAEAAGQDGWKAWAYPISVDLLLVAAWRRMRTTADNRAAWAWFIIALAASLGANVATAGLLDLGDVPAWLRILVAGWPALAFLGGTLLVHAPTTTPSESDPVPAAAPLAAPASDPVPDVTVERAPEPAPELPPVPAAEPAPVPVPAPSPAAVPPALLDHARKLADAHQTATGARIDSATLRARLGVPAPLADAITTQLA